MLKAGEIPLLRSLQERQEQLAERTKQLDQREETLRQVQQQIEEKLATLTLLRKEVGALLEEKTAFETKRFEHLVKVYEGMKPEEAAALVERLDQDTAVHLLAQMKGKKVSPILGALKPDVAVQLSERLAIQQQAQKATAKETP
jgi:flagellar motility protein MotE (MotC chaperone)